MKKLTTEQRERAALAAIVDAATTNQENHNPLKDRPNLAAIIAAAPDAFTDGAIASIALAVKRCVAEKTPPNLVNVGKRLKNGEYPLLSQIVNEALPVELAEVEAAPLLREIESRRAAALLSEALEELRRNPDKAKAIARSTAAALDYQSPEAGVTTERRQWPRPLSEAALIGVAGDFVNMAIPHTEADPAALFFQFMACFANCVGTNHYFQIGRSKHTAREYVLIIGKSAKARKGTSLDWVRDVFFLADNIWSRRIVSGLGSGEGVINQVRDDITETDSNGKTVSVKGHDDKRCMAIESEFGSILGVSARDGCTLSEILRSGWDSGNLQSLVKNNPIRATGAHIGVIGHITESELRAKLSDVAVTNGFANRFLPVCVNRSKMLPDGGNLPDEEFEAFALRLNQTIDTARKIGRMTRSEEANHLWRDSYTVLTDWHDRRHGSFGSITGRAEAHVVRLSICFALLDGQSEIQLCHLKAALESWRYCQESACYIWDDFTQDGLAVKIRAALTKAGQDGLTRSQLHIDLGKRTSPNEFMPELQKLISSGEVTETDKRGTGRTATIYRLR